MSQLPSFWTNLLMPGPVTRRVSPKRYHRTETNKLLAFQLPLGTILSVITCLANVFLFMEVSQAQTPTYSVEAKPPRIGVAESAAFTVAAAVVMFAILGVAFCRGATRVFWSGFALFGWAYLLAVFGPPYINCRDQLLTQQLLEKLPASTHSKGLEQQIRHKLEKPTTLHLKDVPFERIIDDLRHSTAISFVIDQPALQEEGVTEDTPITLQVERIPLKSVLELMLGPFNLGYLIKDDTIQITSRFQRESDESDQKGRFQRLCHSIVTLLIALIGGSLARTCFGDRPVTWPQYSLGFLMCLPLMFALLAAISRMATHQVAVISIFGSLAMGSVVILLIAGSRTYSKPPGLALGKNPPDQQAVPTIRPPVPPAITSSLRNIT